MEFPNAQLPQINLARRLFEPPFCIDMEAFFEFSFWIAEELLDLLAEHRPEFTSLNQTPISNDLRLSKSDRFGLHVD